MKYKNSSVLEIIYYQTYCLPYTYLLRFIKKYFNPTFKK